MYRNPKAGYKAISRISFLLMLAILVGGCQSQEKKMYRVGILCGLDYLTDVTTGFKERMAELGYVEGENVVYDLQSTDFDPAREREILEQFVADEVDLILTFPTEVSILAKEVTAGTDIPVIFTVANIEEVGLVESISYPGGNVTGVRYPGPDIAAKRFELMLDMIPEAKRILIPFQKGYPIVGPQMAILEEIAAQSDVELFPLPADGVGDLGKIINDMERAGDTRFDFILFLAEPLSVTGETFRVISQFGEKFDIPIGGSYMVWEDFHSIFGVNVSIPQCGVQAADQAHRVLSGSPVMSTPVISAESFVDLDLIGAKNAGLEIPEGVIHQADNLVR